MAPEQCVILCLAHHSSNLILNSVSLSESVQFVYVDIQRTITHNSVVATRRIHRTTTEMVNAINIAFP